MIEGLVDFQFAIEFGVRLLTEARMADWWLVALVLQSEMEMVRQFQHQTISVERVPGRLNPGCSPSEANPGRKERMLVPLVEDSRGQEGFA